MSKEVEPRGDREADDKWRPRPCPICSAMSVRAYRPFCSKRCADVDLGRWLNGSYSIAGGPAPQKPDGA